MTPAPGAQKSMAFTCSVFGVVCYLYIQPRNLHGHLTTFTTLSHWAKNKEAPERAVCLSVCQSVLIGCCDWLAPVPAGSVAAETSNWLPGSEPALPSCFPAQRREDSFVHSLLLPVLCDIVVASLRHRGRTVVVSEPAPGC